MGPLSARLLYCCSSTLSVALHECTNVIVHWGASVRALVCPEGTAQAELCLRAHRGDGTAMRGVGMGVPHVCRGIPACEHQHTGAWVVHMSVQACWCTVCASRIQGWPLHPPPQAQPQLLSVILAPSPLEHREAASRGCCAWAALMPLGSWAGLECGRETAGADAQP